MLSWMVEHSLRNRLFVLVFALLMMAWGGMKVGHGISAWAERANWTGALEAALARGGGAATAATAGAASCTGSAAGSMTRSPSVSETK